VREFLSRFLRLIVTSEPSREKRILTISLAILMATLLWIVVTLNQPYKTTLAFPIRIVEVPDSLQLTDLSTPNLRIELSGLGVDLLTRYLQFQRDTIELAFDRVTATSNYLLSNRLRAEVERRIGERLRVEKILTDRVELRYEAKVSRRVPIAFRAKIQLEPTIQLEADPALRDDSVTLYGPQTWIDSVSEWPTRPDYVLSVDRANLLTVPLAKPPPGCIVNPAEVQVFVSPRRYTETLLRVPVEVVNLPESTEVRLSHQVIEVSCLVPLDSYHSLLEEVQGSTLRIPFSKLDPQIPSMIPDLNLPDQVKPIARSPLALSYVIIQP
jgi:YbbR domain-containing protein